MSPEEEAQLRQLLRKASQLPEPDWNLFARATKRWSRMRPERMGIETQARAEVQKELDTKRQAEREVQKKEKEFQKKLKEYDKFEQTRDKNTEKYFEKARRTIMKEYRNNPERQVQLLRDLEVDKRDAKARNRFLDRQARAKLREDFGKTE